jgi:hypothetical protein
MYSFLPVFSQPVPLLKPIIQSAEKNANVSFIGTHITLPRNQAFGPIWNAYCDERNKRFGVDREYGFPYRYHTADGQICKQVCLRLTANMTPDDVVDSVVPDMRLNDGDMIYCIKVTPSVPPPAPTTSFETISEHFDDTDDCLRTTATHHKYVMDMQDNIICGLKNKINELNNDRARLSHEVATLCAQEISQPNCFGFGEVVPSFDGYSHGPSSAIVDQYETTDESDGSMV